MTEHAEAELHASDHEVGQDNIQFFGFDVHNPVFLVAALITVLFVVLSLASPERAGEVFQATRIWTTTQLDWLFVHGANAILVFCLLVAISPFGKVRIGGVDARPDYGYPSWFAMMFAAGVGIGLMFYGVLEPVTHTLNAPLDYADKSLMERAEIGLSGAIFHWGLHAWGIYALVGLALAIFAYNYGLPLTIRSAFYPLLGERVWGWPGHVIDVLAVFATLFGLATSLGLGAQQTAAGLSYIFGIGNTITTQIFVIIGITIIALISVVRGMDRGVKLLSEINMVMAILLLLFVLFAGPTIELIIGWGTATVNYIQHLPALSSWMDRTDTHFYHGWTTFYWAWWVAWSPFVGMFIARVSRGRTVREFILSALIAPSVVGIIWFSTFGSSALIELIAAGSTGVSEAVQGNQVELALFKLLETLPWSTLTSIVALFLIVIFFVSSMDSGSLVVDTITAGGRTDAPVGQRIFWCTFEGLIAIALLVGGGLGALQAASLATGFPFTIVLVLMMVCVFIGLRDVHKHQFG